MKYLLDTNICIYYLNRKENIVSKIYQIPEDDISISIITIAELQHGAYNSKKVQENLEKIDSFAEIVQTVSLTKDITNEYARIKAQLRKGGILIDDFDILIGATALVNNLILVTNNEHHFCRINGLILENWT